MSSDCVSTSSYGGPMVDLSRAAALLEGLAGPGARFRPGQYEALQSLVGDRNRVLVVQRTGWGKSAVYLIATHLLRETGRGPTVIVSPLISLMRNQLSMARRLDLKAETIIAANADDHPRIFDLIANDGLDLLLISPERLHNIKFRSEALPTLLSSLGLLVVDEVHCISIWGHDFRPDYRRLGSLVKTLPPGIPVLGTTATANDHVVRDVEEQLGDDLVTIRGTLERESLALQVNRLPQYADRLAWLASAIPSLPGSGIVYCLTIRDARRVAEWLKQRDIEAVSYTGSDDGDDRLRVENMLSEGRLKVVVATAALGMGYDNPRIHFVIHFQSPGSPIAYYQQVGRAGRAVERSYGVLLAGSEDLEIQDYFIKTAFPSEHHTRQVLDALSQSDSGLRLVDLQMEVNLRPTRLEALLKILEVEGAVYREVSDWNRWRRSAQRYVYPRDRIAAVTRARLAEQQVMVDYLTTKRCLMQTLRLTLDDRDAERCGRCANCRAGLIVEVEVSSDLTALAQRFIKRGYIPILPRRKWIGIKSQVSLRDHGLGEGRALSRWGDTGWAADVARGKYVDGSFSDDLVLAMAEMVRDWDPNPAPQWLTFVPAYGGGGIVADFASRLAAELGIRLVDTARKSRRTQPQKEMQNSPQRIRNIRGAYEATQRVQGAGFLFDDMVDSRWTLTEVGVVLRGAGASSVYPLALADTSGADNT